MTLLALPLAQAAPQGGTVTAGQASIVNRGVVTTVTQGSQRAAIDWRSFNVGASETVNFVQPNASSAILNRVVGNDPSAIFGRINANGQVLLINPNGILFGRTAQVDVGALTATTSNLSNTDFMAGRLNFTEPGKPGATVENQGRITVSEGGFAALVGRQVANSGVITAKLGKVALAGGDAFVLDLYGDKLVNLIVDPAAMGTLTDAQGQPLAARVDHSGQIVADGGQVQLSVGTVKQLVDNLINLSGVVRATSFTNSAGVISLQGDANTQVAVSGTLDASGEQRGGRIEVTGREVALQSGASLAATGGQGSIAVGGDWQGQGTLAHAQQVSVAQGATLDVSGGAQGQGGTAVLWSDRRTEFDGRISAAGGAASGDAGRVEVSSKGQLGFRGDVDVFAANGKQGSLLLDPANLTIAATSAGTSQLSADQLRFLLTRGASVSLAADQNVTVDAEINGLVAGGGGVAGGGLTLTAGNNLTVNRTIALNNGALNLTATSGVLSTTGDAVLYTGSGAINLRGAAGVDAGRVLTSGAVDVRSAQGGVTLRQALVAAGSVVAPVGSLNIQSAGDVTLHGALASGVIAINSGAGVSLNGAVLQSTLGGVTVQAAQGVSSNGTGVGLVANTAVSVSAGDAIRLGVALGGTQVQLDAGTDVRVDQTIANSAGTAVNGVSLSAGGAIGLAGVNAGAGGLTLQAGADVTSTRPLVSSGAVSVTAAGRIGTSAAPISIDAGTAAVDLRGTAGVQLDSLLARGAVTIESSAGGVSIGQAISGAVGNVTASTPTGQRPTSITIQARDTISLGGAGVGTGGLTATSSAGAVNLAGGSIFSDGSVALSALGAVTLGSRSAIDTRNNDSHISLTSTGAGVVVGTGGLRANGQANITLSGRQGVQMQGDLQTGAGTISLTATQGAVTAAFDNTSPLPLAGDAMIDAGGSDTLSRIVVNAGSNVQLAGMRAQNEIVVTSGANVLFRRGLGGGLENTGYANYANGYQETLRPLVGRVEIDAAGSVELNGLNIDGNRLPEATAPGLSVHAGRMIVSNAQIAVNKGNIELISTGTAVGDGVFLGNNVYSRGWDSVGADGQRNTSDDRRFGYGIEIRGRVLGLFDNTEEFATLPSGTRSVRIDSNTTVSVDVHGYLVDVNGQRLTPLQAVVYESGTGFVVREVSSGADHYEGFIGNFEKRDIAKVIVSNNTANYQDPGDSQSAIDLRNRLVPHSIQDTTPNDIAINVQTIAGVANSRGEDGRLVVTDSLQPNLVALHSTPVSVQPRTGVLTSTQGMGLKVLGFEDPSDRDTQIWNDSAYLARGIGGNNFFEDLQTRSRLSIGQVNLNHASAAPVNGLLSVALPVGDVHRVHQVELSDGSIVSLTQTELLVSGSATYNFRLSGTGGAYLESVTLSPGAQLPTNLPSFSNGERLISSGPWINGGDLTPVGSFAQIRFVGNTMYVAEPGRAGHIQVNGALHPSTTGPVQTGATANPVLNSMTIGPDIISSHPVQYFEATRAVVDTTPRGTVTTPCTSTSCNALGTRLFVYDGPIDSVSGRGVSDQTGGMSLPGMGVGILGSNNSAAGFAVVGASFSPNAGQATTATPGQPDPLRATGVGAPTGGAMVDLQVQENRENLGAPGVVGQAQVPGMGDVLLGTRPSAQADLGRSGAVQGASVNVFKRRYRVASASSDAVCAPEAVQSVPQAGGGAVRECASAK